MKKLKKLLPVLIVALALIFTFLSKDATTQPSVIPQSTETPAPVADEKEVFTPDWLGETPLPDVPDETAEPEPAPTEAPEAAIDEDGYYTSKDDVALYLRTYGHLPGNFVTKTEAKKTGWQGGGLDDYLPGMSIGGDKFGNREGLLPEAPGRVWTECDINTMHASSRGAERIVFSNDGLIYYTKDHYETFTPLYE